MNNQYHRKFEDVATQPQRRKLAAVRRAHNEYLRARQTRIDAVKEAFVSGSNLKAICRITGQSTTTLGRIRDGERVRG